ncbi:MAG: hypothetical protein J6A75_13575 [Lachnospiraceae bacterium]|nr:hypothetical protein [Lachnospiraceae bacterium]
MDFEILGFEVPIIMIVLLFLKIIGKFVRNVKIMIAISIGAVIVGLFFGIWLGIKIPGI